jgi:signal transduction histidine kinase
VSFWIDTDPQWIRRIIQNFVSNALRYTAKGEWWWVYSALRSNLDIFELGFGIQDPGLPKNNGLNYSKSLSAVGIYHLGVSKV